MLCYKKSSHYLSPRNAYIETKFISQEEECFNKISILDNTGEGQLNIARDKYLCVKLTQTITHVWLLRWNLEKHSYKIVFIFGLNKLKLKLRSMS